MRFTPLIIDTPPRRRYRLLVAEIPSVAAADTPQKTTVCNRTMPLRTLPIPQPAGTLRPAPSKMDHASVLVRLRSKADSPVPGVDTLRRYIPNPYNG